MKHNLLRKKPLELLRNFLQRSPETANRTIDVRSSTRVWTIDRSDELCFTFHSELGDLGYYTRKHAISCNSISYVKGRSESLRDQVALLWYNLEHRNNKERRLSLRGEIIFAQREDVHPDWMFCEQYPVSCGSGSHYEIYR